MCLTLFLIAGQVPWSALAYGVEIHGFYSQGYMKSTDRDFGSTDNDYMAETSEGTFQFNEMGLNFSTDLTDELRIGMQFFARDLGPEGNDEIKLDWAYADYRFKDYLGLRVGKVKLVVGLYNDVRELDMTRTSVLLPQGVYTETWRDNLSGIKGVSLYGDVPIPVIGSFQYTLQAGMITVSKDTGFAVAFEERLSKYSLTVTDMDADVCYSGALEYQPSLVDGLRLKYTYYDIQNVTFAGASVVPTNAFGKDKPPIDYPTTLMYRVNTLDRYVISAEYMRGDFTFVGEYTIGEFQGDLKFDGLTGWIDRDPVKGEGWYITGSYRFNDLFEWGIGYSNYYPNKDDKDGDDQAAIEGKPDYTAWEKDFYSSFRFDLNEWAILKFEIHVKNGFGAYSAAQDPDVIPEEDWLLFASKITFTF